MLQPRPTGQRGKQKADQAGPRPPVRAAARVEDIAPAGSCGGHARNKPNAARLAQLPEHCARHENRESSGTICDQRSANSDGAGHAMRHPRRQKAQQ